MSMIMNRDFPEMGGCFMRTCPSN